MLAQSVSTADTLVNAVASADSITFSIKNIFNLQAGDNGEVLVSSGQSLLFYDDGGLDGDYTKGFDGTVTFAPKTPGESVKLPFKCFNVTYQDKFYIYNGGEVGEKADATYSRYDKPDYFVSESEDGKLTVRFVTKMASEGFAIEVTAYQKQPLHIASVATQPVAPESVMKGEEDVKMVRMDVQVDGDLD